MDGMMQHDWTNEHAKLTLRPSSVIAGADGRLLELVGLWTDPEHRKQGYATELMKAVCDASDAASVVLMLTPKAFGEGGLQDLVPFYARFGFSVIQKAPALMARMPRAFKPKLSVVGGAVSELRRG